jgi:hypothetical protein
MTGNEASLDLPSLWAEVNRFLREGPVNRPLWEAAQVAVPLALDGDLLVLGLAPRDSRHASYLQTDVNRTRLRQILHARTGRYLDLRVIEGTQPDDWSRVQEREQSAQELNATAVRRAASYRSVEELWEQGSQRLSELFTSATARAYATTRARLLTQGLPLIYATEQAVRQQASHDEEAHQRHLNRLLDKLALQTDLPPTLVALEYSRHVAQQQRPQ